MARRPRLDQQHVLHGRPAVRRPARTAAFDPGVLQVETIAQSAERGGLKVAQVEWAGGRNATIQGPTIDFQSFFSGRGVATNFIGTAGDALFDDGPFIASFGLQFDHPAGYPGQAPFPGAADAGGRLAGRPGVVQPGQGDAPPRPRRGGDKYGLNAYIFDSTNDGTTNYDKVLFSKTKSAADSVGTLRKGEWADVKVKISGGALDGKTAGMLVKVEELTGDLSRVRLFHTSVSRAIASWPTWGGAPGFPGDFDEFLAQKFPTSTAADFAILEAGVTSEDTYVQQGLYWATGHQPMLEYVAKTYKPDLLLVGVPTTDEFQHQFLGLVSPTLPNGAANPAYDDVDLNGVKDGRVAAREGYIRTAYAEADETLTLARKLVGQRPAHVRLGGPRLRAAVPRHRRQPAAGRHEAPDPAPDVQLPDRGRRADPQGEGLLGRWHRPDLPERRDQSGDARSPGRPGRGDRRRDQGQVPRPHGPERLDPRRPARRLEDDRPRLHPGPRPATSRTAPAARPTWPIPPGRATS